MTLPSTTKEQGFTIVETLVAISVLLLAVAAPLTLGSQGLTASRIARDQMIATYLAQEAVEHVRNTRDTNRLQGRSWLTGFDACIGGSCTIDVPLNAIAACDGEDGCAPVRYETANGRYGYTAGQNWQDTKFTRTVEIVPSSVAYEARVIATVTWNDGLKEHEVIVDEYMLNWQ